MLQQHHQQQKKQNQPCEWRESGDVKGVDGRDALGRHLSSTRSTSAPAFGRTSPYAADVTDGVGAIPDTLFSQALTDNAVQWNGSCSIISRTIKRIVSAGDAQCYIPFLCGSRHSRTVWRHLLRASGAEYHREVHFLQYTVSRASHSLQCCSDVLTVRLHPNCAIQRHTTSDYQWIHNLN